MDRLLTMVVQNMLDDLAWLEDTKRLFGNQTLQMTTCQIQIYS